MAVDVDARGTLADLLAGNYARPINIRLNPGGSISPGRQGTQVPGVASCHMSPPALGDHLHNVFCNEGLGLDLNRLIIMGIKLRSPRGRELLNLFFFFSFDIFDEKNLKRLNGIVS